MNTNVAKPMKKILKNQVFRNILSALAVAIFGFILLNLTFIFDAVFQGAIRGFAGLFVSLNYNAALYWFPPLMHFSFVLVIGVISFFVFRSKLKVIYKAIYMSVPVAVVLVSVGMFLYNWPVLTYFIGSLLCIGTLYCFYRTKQPWIYYYTVILVGLSLAIFALLGGEI